MVELLAGVVVAGAAVLLVLEPLMTGHRDRAHEAEDEPDFTPLEESASPKIQALIALKEIEFDRETGKLSDADYLQLKAKYSRMALEAMEVEDAAAAGGPSNGAPSGPTEDQDPVEAAIRRAAAGELRCPQCGARPEAVAAFCSDCGRRLTAAPAQAGCAACGAQLPAGAKFCSECGAGRAPGRATAPSTG